MAVIFDEVVGTVEPPVPAQGESAPAGQNGNAERSVDPESVVELLTRIEVRAARLAGSGW